MIYFRREILSVLSILFGLNQLVVGQNCPPIDLCPNSSEKVLVFQMCPEAPRDPNEIIGTIGYGDVNYINKRENILHYTIYFENDAEEATAPAQEILLIDTLDLTKFNPEDFSFGTFTFRDIIIDAMPKVTEFSKDVDMRQSGENIIIRITATFDKETGIIRCHFIAYDPVTMDLTESPFLGVLYPNTEPPVGEGNITYRIGVLPSVTHGDVIANQAHIIFDLNEPIATNIFINTIDTIPPHTSMSYSPSGINDSTYVISWGGSDMGSGIRNYTVYMSQGDEEFFVWRYYTTATSDTLIGNMDSTYKFYCIATDNVGNREESKDFDIQFAMTTTSISEKKKQNSDEKVYPNPTKGQLTINNEQLTIEKIEIYDVVGQLLVSKIVNLQSEIIIDVSHLANGMYFLKVDNKVVKIIKN